MKIIFATDTFWPRISGATVSVDSFRLGLIKAGHEVHTFAPEYPQWEDENFDPDSYENVHFLKSYKFFVTKEDSFVHFTEGNKIFKLMDEVKADIIHVQTEAPMGMIGWHYGRRRKMPMVLSHHTYYEEYIMHYFPKAPAGVTKGAVRKATKVFFNQGDAIIAPSQMIKDVLKDYGIKRPIVVIPTGIQTEDFVDNEKALKKNLKKWYKEYPQFKGKKLLLYVGRMRFEKNPIFLLKMVKKVAKKYPDVQLVFTGDGGAAPELKKIVKEMKIEHLVTFTGYVPRDRMKEIYTLADIFTLASKTETQGLVTTEAMLCGTPVVAIGEMGTKDVMKGDNGGFMVPDDMDIFCNRVLQLLTDEKLYKRKARQGIKYAEDWTMEASINKLVKVYEKSVKGTYKRRGRR